ncbi:head-tail adaptor protein [bacterium]|nr:head-tail adaptor protein [bacterium]
MALAAGTLRETVLIEQQQETRNALGETTVAWVPFATRRASVESISYQEQERRKQIGGTGTFVVRCRFVDGITGKMRVKWSSRSDRLLYIASVVERGHRDEHELTCDEKAT